MVHAIEAYTTKIKKNPISDALAKKALALLGNNIREAVNNPENKKARESMLTRPIRTESDIQAGAGSFVILHATGVFKK